MVIFNCYESCSCLFGNAGYKQKLAGNDPSNLDSYDLTIPIESIKDNIAKPHNADVFIHSWSKEHSNLINKVFEPISAIYEEPRNFSRHVEHKKNFIQSRWYSEYQSNKLKKIYEKENGFNYDVVVHSRLDVIWFNKIILNNKDETLFVSHWNKTLNDNKLGPFDKENVYQGYALHDWWFYGARIQWIIYQKFTSINTCFIFKIKEPGMHTDSHI